MAPRRSTAGAVALGVVLTVAGLSAPRAGAQPAGPSATGQCTGLVPSTTPSSFNRTPRGAGPWHVPLDPCNPEPLAHYTNCAYWGAEKRPDIWQNAVLQPDGGYGHGASGGAWNIKIDAATYGYRISHRPKAGDLAAWPPNATMGSEKSGSGTIIRLASPGGHVAYVEKAWASRVKLSTTGIGSHGGYTFILKFNKHKTFFIHRGGSSS